MFQILLQLKDSDVLPFVFYSYTFPIVKADEIKFGKCFIKKHVGQNILDKQTIIVDYKEEIQQPNIFLHVIDTLVISPDDIQEWCEKDQQAAEKELGEKTVQAFHELNAAFHKGQIKL